MSRRPSVRQLLELERLADAWSAIALDLSYHAGTLLPMAQPGESGVDWTRRMVRELLTDRARLRKKRQP